MPLNYVWLYIINFIRTSRSSGVSYISISIKYMPTCPTQVPGSCNIALFSPALLMICMYRMGRCQTKTTSSGTNCPQKNQKSSGFLALYSEGGRIFWNIHDFFLMYPPPLFMAPPPLTPFPPFPKCPPTQGGGVAVCGHVRWKEFFLRLP